jgi:hypothetical protein
VISFDRRSYCFALSLLAAVFLPSALCIFHASTSDFTESEGLTLS